jgi:hypothetical protein
VSLSFGQTPIATHVRTTPRVVARERILASCETHDRTRVSSETAPRGFFRADVGNEARVCVS